MIIENTQNTEAINPASLSERNFDILANDKMFSILSSKIYTDKILAPIRELSCNAYDANIEAGKGDVPIRIHIPSYEMNTYFSVEDNGNGMDDEEIVKLYSTYGASSKTSSNETIGCLGLGSKAPFAYTDKFTVTSVKNGYERKYECVMDGSLPKLVKISETAVFKPSGTKVSFKVDSGDTYAFRRRCSEFFGNFNPRPEIENPADFSIEAPYAFDNGLCYGEGIYTHGVLMGNVLYKYDIYKFVTEHKDFFDRFVRNPTILKVDIGEIDITVSREEVELTKKTMDCIVKKHNEFIEAKKKEIENYLLNSKNILEYYRYAFSVVNRYRFIVEQDESNPYMKAFSSESVWAEDRKDFNVIVLSKSGRRHKNYRMERVCKEGEFSFTNIHPSTPRTIFFYSHLEKIQVPKEVKDWTQDCKTEVVLFNSLSLKAKLEELGFEVLTKDDLQPKAPRQKSDKSGRIDTNRPLKGIYEVSTSDRYDSILKFTSMENTGNGLLDLLEKQTVYYIIVSNKSLFPEDAQRLESVRNKYSDGKDSIKRIITYLNNSSCAVVGISKSTYEEIKDFDNWKPFIDHIENDYKQEDADLYKSLKFVSYWYYMGDFLKDVGMAVIEAGYERLLDDMTVKLIQFKNGEFDLDDMDDRDRLYANIFSDHFESMRKGLFDKAETLLENRYPLLMNVNTRFATRKDLAEYIRLKESQYSAAESATAPETLMESFD